MAVNLASEVLSAAETSTGLIRKPRSKPQAADVDHITSVRIGYNLQRNLASISWARSGVLPVRHKACFLASEQKEAPVQMIEDAYSVPFRTIPADREPLFPLTRICEALTDWPSVLNFYKRIRRDSYRFFAKP